MKIIYIYRTIILIFEKFLVLLEEIKFVFLI